MTRGSPAGSLTKKPFVLNSRSNDAAVTSSGGPRDRKVSRMQMGMFLGLHNFLLSSAKSAYFGTFSHHFLQPLIGLLEKQESMKTTEA